MFIGIQSYGEVTDDFLRWLDESHVRGRDGSDSIDGYAFDFGSSYEFSASWKPSLMLGYALGSGDPHPTMPKATAFAGLACKIISTNLTA